MPFADHPVRRVAAAEGIRPSGRRPHTIPAYLQAPERYLRHVL
ncbi:hypothetical protein [Kribbella steppae]|nr:hypothetical protein [Kribbella steppae]